MALDEEDALVIALDEEEAHDGPRLRRGLTASRRQQVLADFDVVEFAPEFLQYLLIVWKCQFADFVLLRDVTRVSLKKSKKRPMSKRPNS